MSIPTTVPMIVTVKQQIFLAKSAFARHVVTDSTAWQQDYNLEDINLGSLKWYMSLHVW